MATRIKYKNRIKAKVWGESATMEIEGGIDEMLPYTLYYIDTPERREKIIAAMQKIHEEMCKPKTEADGTLN